MADPHARYFGAELGERMLIPGNDALIGISVNEMTPKWSQRLAGFDVFIWDQCYSMEQSLCVD